VEIKIGVQYAPRELVLDSSLDADQIEAAVSEALSPKGSGVFTLTDDRGRRVVVPVDKLAYIEIGEPEQRRVGFGAM
jgi:hypothetical protein